MDPLLRNNIIKALGLDPEYMTAEQIDAVIEKTGILIYQSVLQKVMEQLPDADVDEFGRLMDEESEFDKIIAFLRSKVPDFDDLIKKEAEAFAAESRKVMGEE